MTLINVKVKPIVSKIIPLITPANASIDISHKVYSEDNTTKAVQATARNHHQRETLRGKASPLSQTFLVLDKM